MKPKQTGTEDTSPDVSKLQDLQSGEIPPSEGTAAAVETPQTKVRKKRGPNKPKESPAIVEIPRELMAAVVRGPYDVIAARLGSHWSLTDSEADRMVDAHLKLSQRYLPETIQKKPELYTVLVLHGLMLYSKITIHYKLVQEYQASLAEQGELPIEGDNTLSGENRFGKVIPSKGETEPPH